LEELQLTLTPARVDQRNFGVQLSNWRVGQQLTALVVESRPNGALLLSVGGKTFTASSDLPVQAGTRMAMEVKQAGQELVLRRIPDASLPRADASGRAVETTLALGSPRPAALLNQLSLQAARFGSSQLQELTRTLRSRALKVETLSAGEVQKGLRDSGLFTEVDLLAGRSNRAGQSSKANLSQIQAVALALADDLDEGASEIKSLHQIVDKALSLLKGISQQQLASLPQDDGGQRWLFTLPAQLGEQFHDVQLQLEREAREADQPQGWRASLCFEFPEMGSMTVQIQLQGSSVSVAFECGKPDTSLWLTRSMPSLENQLNLRNLRAVVLSTSVTTPANDPASDSSGLSIEA
jgi:hypothetical protein